MHKTSSDRARTWLAWIRIVNGALGLAAQSFLAKRVSGKAEANPAATYAFRLFGIRTVLIGLDLLSRERDVRDRAVGGAFRIHASDTMTAASLALRRQVRPRAGLMLTAISAFNVFLALRARTRET
jgi:hypothetical protein